MTTTGTFLDLIGPGLFIDPAVIQTSAAAGDDWYPYAAAMPLTPEATSQPRGDKTTFILHSMAGPKLTSLEALWKYLNRTDITGECTWIGDLDGRVAQTVPVDVRADNNYRANPFATSIETQDHGSPTLATTPWSDPLMAQLAGLSAWQALHPKLDIPLRRADQGWDGGGIDGHRRYPEWSKYVGKTCPGQARWEQIDDVIAAAELIVAWTPEPAPIPPSEDDMTTYICRTANVNELRMGDGVTAVVLRSREFALFKALWTTDAVPVGRSYHHPLTGQALDAGTWTSIPLLGEDYADLLVGYPDYERTGRDEG